MAESAGYQVVARRYRPRVFADLVGQEHVAKGLSGAIESGRIGHAYLFTGARGVGKTSAARIYAKALECEKGPAAEPCNECDSCRAISAGQDVDVVEIDAASNRGIDEIRQLRQNVAVRPARGRFKIYIIDEVHMLTREAFNALLKTLEEPPAHVKFVLCTTEPEKLPITILSRCQRFDFTTVATGSIAGRLAQIVEAEGADVSTEALMLIARRAAGSMRDSQSLLEQLLGAAVGPIAVDDVHALIGTGREERIGDLVTAIAAREPALALAALDASLQGGADPGGVLEQLLAAFRDSLLASVGCDPARLVHSQPLGVDLVALGGQLGTATLLAMLQILDQSLSRMRTSGHAPLLAEMAVIRLATLEDLDSLAAVIDRLAGTTASSASGPAGIGAAGQSPGNRDTGRQATPPPRVASPAPQKKTADVTLPGGEAHGNHQPERGAGARLPADPRAAWKAATADLGGLAGDFAAEATGAVWRDDRLEVELPAAAAAFLRRPEVAAGINGSLQELAGRPVGHVLVVGKQSASAPVADEPVRPVTSQAGLLRDVADHPLVSHARTLFDVAIRRVEPPRPRERPAAVSSASMEVAATGEPAGGDDSERTVEVSDG